MSRQPATGSSNQPLGTTGDQRRRVLLHHVPLALASAVVLVLFMSLPLFDVHAYPHADIVTGTFPQERRDGGATGHAGGQTGRTDHEGNHNGLIRHGEDQAGRHSGSQTGPTGHITAETEAVVGDGDHAEPVGHSGRARRAVRRPGEAGMMGTELGDHGGDIGLPNRADVSVTRSMQQFTVATGYLGLGLLAFTLLLGPANLLLRRRNPVSIYLRRDVGAWAAIFSVVHVIGALLIHVTHGSGLFSSFVHFFVAEDGSALTNSFGLGNWTGLAAVLIVLGLLATSSDSALRKLKARPWKWLQRVSYALFALVVLHAFFYGALLRMTSPFTLLLVLSVMAVFLGQATGVWLWRRRYAGLAAIALWSSFGVFVPSTVLAQQRPASQEKGSVRSQESPDAQDGPLYDPKSEATFTGTVAEVHTGGPGRLQWLMRVHTLGLGHKGADEKQLLLKTDADTLRIHLGPTAFLSDRKMDIKEGDRLAVTGSRVTLGDSQVVLAREIRKGDTAWTLRNAAGQPLWSTTEQERRRFWTTTKVVLIVVAAKVALLATVLRH